MNKDLEAHGASVVAPKEERAARGRDAARRWAARALDLPMGTVMSRLHYARSRLREILTPVMEDL